MAPLRWLNTRTYHCSSHHLHKLLSRTHLPLNTAGSETLNSNRWSWLCSIFLVSLSCNKRCMHALVHRGGYVHQIPFFGRRIQLHFPCLCWPHWQEAESPRRRWETTARPAIESKGRACSSSWRYLWHVTTQSEKRKTIPLQMDQRLSRYIVFVVLNWQA